MLRFKLTEVSDLVKVFAICSFVLFALNSVFSIAGYSDDQHFQIIEFANFKRGGIPETELAWEYRYRERQAIQPACVYLLLGICELFNISDPLTQTQILRLVTALIMVFCMTRFVKATFHYFKPEFVRLYLFVSFLVWYIPCYYVHFASETFSQALMLLGTACLMRRSREAPGLVWAGFWFGLAFFARFQSAITMLILLPGLLIYARAGIKQLFFLAGGGLIGLVIGVAADFWFYGELVFTPYRYFDFQLTKGVVNAFGTSPFYEYWRILFLIGTPVFGVLFYVALLGNILAARVTTVFLSVIGTILFLSLIGHKEARFLLQVAAFFPFVMVYGIQAMTVRRPFYNRFIRSRFVAGGLIILNFGLFAFHTLRNNGMMGTEPGALAPVITREYYDRNVRLFYTSDYWHPFQSIAFDPEPAPGQGHFSDFYLQRRFYLPKEYSEQKVSGLGDTVLYENKPGTVNLLYVTKAVALGSSDLDNLYASGYILSHSSIPLWIDVILPEEGDFGKKVSSKITYLFEKASP